MWSLPIRVSSKARKSFWNLLSARYIDICWMKWHPLISVWISEFFIMYLQLKLSSAFMKWIYRLLFRRVEPIGYYWFQIWLFSLCATVSFYVRYQIRSLAKVLPFHTWLKTLQESTQMLLQWKGDRIQWPANWSTSRCTPYVSIHAAVFQNFKLFFWKHYSFSF